MATPQSLSERPAAAKAADSTRLIWAGLGAIVVIGIVLRLMRMGDSVFGDELSTLYIVKGNSLSGAISAVSSDAEISPPLYFVLAWFATHLGSAPELVRLPSLIAGVAAMPLTYLVGARTAGRTAGVIAAAFMAINPFMVFYSADGRGYMVAIALLLTSTLAMLLAVDTGRRRWWVLYGGASCLAMYAHYTSAFVLIAQLGWLLWAHPAARRGALLANIGAAVLYLPWLPSFFSDQSSPTIDVLSKLDGDGFAVKRMATEAWGFGSPYVLTDRVPGSFALTIGVIGVALAVVAGFVRLLRPGFGRLRERMRDERSRRFLLLFVLALSTPVFEAVLLFAGGSDLYGARNLLTSSPGLALSTGALIAAAGPLVGTIAGVAVFAALGIGVVRSVETHNATLQFKQQAKAFGTAAAPGDVLIDTASTQLTPTRLTPIDAYLGSAPGPEFRLFLPSGPPPFLAFGSPVPDPDRLLGKAFSQADGHNVFIAGSQLQITEGDVGEKPSISQVSTPDPYTQNLVTPHGWKVVSTQTWDGIGPLELYELAETGSGGGS